MTKEAERFTLRLTCELKEQLDESRKRMGVSLNAFVLQILWDWAKQNQQERLTDPIKGNSQRGEDVTT